MNLGPALVIFARAPMPGAVKTRLAPLLGPGRAAELYRRFLLDVLAQASRAAAAVIAAAAEAEGMEAVEALAAAACPRASVTVQCGGDLGARMSSAVRQALDLGHCPVVVLGSDAPALPASRIEEALRLSTEYDVVLGPCFDGGYYLVGLRAHYPAVFTGIPWSTDAVLVETLRRARESGASVRLLEPWFDVDTPDDLARLRRYLLALSTAGCEIPCPQTWEYLSDLPWE